MQVKVYIGKSAVEAAELAINKHLYVDGWCLVIKLKQLIKDGRGKLALCFEGEEPVAICLLTEWNQLMTFCKSAHRRKGYGSACATAMARHCEDSVFAQEGIAGSDCFWKSIGVTVEESIGS